MAAVRRSRLIDLVGGEESRSALIRRLQRPHELVPSSSERVAALGDLVKVDVRVEVVEGDELLVGCVLRRIHTEQVDRMRHHTLRRSLGDLAVCHRPCLSDHLVARPGRHRLVQLAPEVVSQVDHRQELGRSEPACGDSKEFVTGIPWCLGVSEHFAYIWWGRGSSAEVPSRPESQRFDRGHVDERSPRSLRGTVSSMPRGYRACQTS